MTQVTERLVEAQKYAMSIRPRIGGFPVLAEVLRQAGVTMNRWALPSCQAIYHMTDGTVLQQGTPLVSGFQEIPSLNREALITALRTDQEGRSTFAEFLQSVWKAGVIGYDVDFRARKVTYYDAHGESYQEEYPAVEVKK